MEELYERTRNRIFELKRHYDVEVMWECELKRQLRENPERRQIYDSIFIPQPLDPRRDGLRGGRVEPFCFAYECRSDEEIIDIDVVS